MLALNDNAAIGAVMNRVLARRAEHVVLAVMLLALSLSLRSGLGSPLAASLMTVHLGLFFIWQPIWQRDQRLDPVSIVIILLFSSVFVALLNWWFVFLWLILLTGIVAGRTIGSFSERVAYMLALACLASELLVTCVVALFNVRNLAPDAVDLFRYGLLILPIVIAFIPVNPQPAQSAFNVDFVRTINFALMSALLAFGSVTLTFETAMNYPFALALCLLALSLFLLFLGWLLSPRAGAGNLFQLWERSLLNIGTPFEQWLARLAATSDAHSDPQKFLQHAVEQLVEIPFVAGAQWRSGGATGQAGSDARYKFDYDAPDLSLSIFTRRSVGPTLLLHYKLLLQLIWHFYSARLRAHEVADQAHLQAIHETGARLTHDIKNLLQSLNTLTGELLQIPEYAADPTTIERRRRGDALLRRQLPHISQRLQLALDKLQKPGNAPADSTSVRNWSNALRQRLSDRRIVFRDDIEADIAIPTECFDSVLENLLENALYKSKLDGDVAISVSLHADSAGVRLDVRDTGSALDPQLGSQLFRKPVDSSSGFGVGLYQAARLAENAGYTLTLSNNVPGDVCFTLAIAGTGAPSPARNGEV